MRHIILGVVLSGCLPTVALAQAGATPIKPCSLLTRELVQKVSLANKKIDAAPTEERLGASGTACDWGDLMLQVDPFTAARFEEMRKTYGAKWEAIPGVGDAAYLHNVQNTVAELFVRVGARTFGMMVTVPVGSTTAAMKPSIIEVANAIVPKLR
jgi:hypothetical protein